MVLQVCCSALRAPGLGFLRADDGERRGQNRAARTLTACRDPRGAALAGRPTRASAVTTPHDDDEGGRPTRRDVVLGGGALLLGGVGLPAQGASPATRPPRLASNPRCSRHGAVAGLHGTNMRSHTRAGHAARSVGAVCDAAPACAPAAGHAVPWAHRLADRRWNLVRLCASADARREGGCHAASLTRAVTHRRAWGNEFLWGGSDEAELERAFAACVDAGITFFDTADSYGAAEARLGRFSAQSSAGNVAIASKIASFPTRLTPESIVAAAKASLRRLQRRTVDIMQIHWSTEKYAPWQEGALWEGMARCWEQGLCLAVGLSNYGPKSLRRVAAFMVARGVPLVSVQVQYSLLSRAPERTGLLEAAAEQGMCVIAYSPLCLGLLTGKYSAERLPSGPRAVLFRQLLEEAGPLLSAQRAIAAERELSMSQVAVAWCVAKGTIPIPGVRTAAQAAELGRLLTASLSDGEVAELDRASGALQRDTLQNIFQTG